MSSPWQNETKKLSRKVLIGHTERTAEDHYNTTEHEQFDEGTSVIRRERVPKSTVDSTELTDAEKAVMEKDRLSLMEELEIELELTEGRKVRYVYFYLCYFSFAWIRFG